MFKQRVNEVEINVVIRPVTPLLIKASDTGADPTRPDMEFLTTIYRGQQTVYLPGSSLKGAIRAHAERIIRTVGGDSPVSTPWACNPLTSDSPCRKIQEKDYPTLYKKTCFACRVFGSTETASHLNIGDAYPQDISAVVLEERNSVAIDRKLGSAAGGALFNFQVVTDGAFKARIQITNFSVDQLALIGLVIRDFDTQAVSLGFAKSRGLGQVSMKVDSVQIRYPGCILENGIKVLKTGKTYGLDEVLGAGNLFDNSSAYGYPADDKLKLAVQAHEADFGIGVMQNVPAELTDSLWKESVGCWRKQIKGAVRK